MQVPAPMAATPTIPAAAATPITPHFELDMIVTIAWNLEAILDFLD